MAFGSNLSNIHYIKLLAFWRILLEIEQIFTKHLSIKIPYQFPKYLKSRHLAINSP